MEKDVKDAIVHIFANLVRAGARTIETLPEEYREDVKKYMENNSVWR